MSGNSNSSPEQLAALLNGPAAPPPPGVTPNLDDPPNGNRTALAIFIVTLTLASTFFLLYVYGRIFQVKKFHISDLIGVLAYGSFIGFIYAEFKVYETTGFLIHLWDVRLSAAGEFLIWFSYGIVFYLSTLLLAKAAILLQWMRIFVPTGTRNSFFWCCCTLITIDVAFFLTAVLLEVIGCAPFEVNPTKLATCAPGSKYIDLISSIINLGLDLSILLLPQTVIWKLQMPRATRTGVSIIFAIGILAFLAATVRAGLAIYYFKDKEFSGDVTYSTSIVALITLVEVTCSILVFSVPGTPKAVAALSRNALVTTVTSWANSSVRVLRSKRSRATMKTSSPRNTHSYELPRSGDEHRLTPPRCAEANGASRVSSKDSRDKIQGQFSEAHIIRTTEFSTAEHYDPTKTKYSYPHDHDWA